MALHDLSAGISEVEKEIASLELLLEDHYNYRYFYRTDEDGTQEAADRDRLEFLRAKLRGQARGGAQSETTDAVSSPSSPPPLSSSSSASGAMTGGVAASEKPLLSKTSFLPASFSASRTSSTRPRRSLKRLLDRLLSSEDEGARSSGPAGVAPAARKRAPPTRILDRAIPLSDEASRRVLDPR